jgi:hypothetical protein
MAFVLIDSIDVKLMGGAVVLAIGGIAALLAFLRQRASRSWPTVTGKILYGRAKGVTDSHGITTWYAEMTYSFTTLSGDYYGGRYDHYVANEERADEYARQMKDAKVTVRYKPSNPDTSVVTPAATARAGSDVR